MNSDLELQKNNLLDQLSSLYAEDQISLEEYEQWTEQVTALQTLGDLQGVQRNIPGLPSLARGNQAMEVYQGSPSQTSVAIFSGTSVAGRFHAAQSHQAIAVFGGVDIDLRQAVIPPEGMTIHVVAVFGGVDVIIPEDVNLEISGIGIFGGFSGKRHRAHNPDAPTVRIDGIALFGGMDVKVR